MDGQNAESRTPGERIFFLYVFRNTKTSCECLINSIYFIQLTCNSCILLKYEIFFCHDIQMLKVCARQTLSRLLRLYGKELMPAMAYLWQDRRPGYVTGIRIRVLLRNVRFTDSRTGVLLFTALIPGTDSQNMLKSLAWQKVSLTSCISHNPNQLRTFCP